jgi:hypothetical protein
VLASLLPGLRQLRTPLAIGYLWLLNLWLLFADDLPRKPTDGLVGNVFELAGFLGDAILLAAISFGAFIIGSISLLAPNSLFAVNVFVNSLPRLPFRALPASFLVAVSDLWQRQGLQGIRWSETLSLKERRERDSDIRSTVRELIIQRSDLRAKLLTTDIELYSEYDRLEAEADFRLNISVPLAVLCGILAYEVNPVWLLGLAPVAVLFWRGTTRAFDAVTVLIRAILVGKIEASETPAITDPASGFVRRALLKVRSAFAGSWKRLPS